MPHFSIDKEMTLNLSKENHERYLMMGHKPFFDSSIGQDFQAQSDFHDRLLFVTTPDGTVKLAFYIPSRYCK